MAEIGMEHTAFIGVGLPGPVFFFFAVSLLLFHQEKGGSAREIVTS